MQLMQCECGEMFVTQIHSEARIVNQWDEGLHQSEHEQWCVEAILEGPAYRPSNTPKDHSDAPGFGHLGGVCLACRATIMLETVPTVTLHIQEPRHHMSMREAVLLQESPKLNKLNLTVMA